MTIIASIDGPNRLIHLHSDTVNVDVHPIDIYKEMRTLRKDDEDLRKYDLFLEAKGNDPKGGGKFTERYVIEKFGTRIVPYDASQELTITGTIITDDGQEGIACFDRTPLNPASIVDINYVPPQVEVVVISGGSGLDVEEHDWLNEIYSGVERVVYLNTDLIPAGDGSATDPFNSVALAVDYASLKGISKISVESDIMLDRNITNLIFTGVLHIEMDLDGFTIHGCTFVSLSIKGNSIGHAHYFTCNILNLKSGLRGTLHDCALIGDITAEDGANIDLHNCFSGSASANRPTINLGTSGTVHIGNRGWFGGLDYYNITGSDAVIHESAGSAVTLDATNVGGLFIPRGSIFFTDNSNGTTIVDNGLAMLSGEAKVKEIWQMSRMDPDNPRETDEDGTIRVGGKTITASTSGTTPNRTTTQTRS